MLFEWFDYRVYQFLHSEDGRGLEYLQNYCLLTKSPEPLVGLRGPTACLSLWVAVFTSASSFFDF